jgi:predicted RNA-binding protein
MAALQAEFGARFDIADPPALSFHQFVVEGYRPPADKPWLAILQCSVRRPFSASPSHAWLRRAIRAATGFDPACERDRCPVHVVVLASRLGPVPYELEGVYPANVRAGGVKEFDEATYRRYRPVLAARLAEYLTTHREQYLQIAAFGQGRYAQVIGDAGALAGVAFPIVPDSCASSVRRVGRSRPRTYWERYWIQLYDAITAWLDPGGQRAAAERLRALDVERR